VDFFLQVYSFFENISFAGYAIQDFLVFFSHFLKLDIYDFGYLRLNIFFEEMM